MSRKRVVSVVLPGIEISFGAACLQLSGICGRLPLCREGMIDVVYPSDNKNISPLDLGFIALPIDLITYYN